jgi:GNAT superfamily N-acetyltransferase
MKLLLENWQKYITEFKVPELDSVAQDLGIELRIYDDERNNILTLDTIIVPKELRGQGLGSTAMKKIIQYADKSGKIVALTPSDAHGGSKTRLIKFYKQFGFVMNKGRNKNYATRELMIRNPQ